LIYNSASDSYTLTQSCVESGATSTQEVVCQSGKMYNIPYVVYEKTFPCATYPADEIVTFKVDAMECDGVDCLTTVKWTTDIMDDNCNMVS
jgi:hypothetical protein